MTGESETTELESVLATLAGAGGMDAWTTGKAVGWPCTAESDATTGRADELGVPEGVSVTGMAVDPWVESNTAGIPGSNEGAVEDTATVTEELDKTDSGAIEDSAGVTEESEETDSGAVELTATLGILVELTPIVDETNKVGKAVELAEVVGETTTIDTEIPLGAEIVVMAEHCEETTLSPQEHCRTIEQLASDGVEAKGSRQKQLHPS